MLAADALRRGADARAGGDVELDRVSVDALVAQALHGLRPLLRVAGRNDRRDPLAAELACSLEPEPAVGAGDECDLGHARATNQARGS